MFVFCKVWWFVFLPCTWRTSIMWENILWKVCLFLFVLIFAPCCTFSSREHVHTRFFFFVLTEITSHVTTSFSLFHWEMFLWMYKKTLIWGERLILHFKLLFCRVIECIHLVSAMIYSSSFFLNKKLDIFPQQTVTVSCENVLVGLKFGRETEAVEPVNVNRCRDFTSQRQKK